MKSDCLRLSAVLVGAVVGLVMVSAAAGAPPEKAAAGGPDEAAPAKEQSIYIPYTKLREVFEREGRGVFLPYEKFLNLWQAAREKAGRPPVTEPPVDALIAEVENKATVSEDVVTVKAVVKIEVLKEGWTEVLLRLSDAAITRATVGGQPARLLFDPDRGYKLLVEKKGKKPQLVSLSLEFAKAYTKAPGENSVSFECPQAPVSRWEVRIPEVGVKVNIDPLLAATEVPPAGQAKETVVLAFVGAAPTVRINWTPKAEGAKGLEALASVRAHQEVHIEEGVTRTRARLAYEISRAELARLVVEVPADQKVVNVFDPNVREWAVGAADGAQHITVQLFEPARKSQNLTVELEQFTSGDRQDLKVPVVKAVGVGRQQGVVVVRIGEGLRAEAVSRSGLLQVDPQELPGALARGQWDFSYRYAALPFELLLGVEKIQPRLVAESLVEVHLQPEGLTLDLLTLYTVERAGVFQFLLRIPSDYDVRQVGGVSVAGASAAQVDGHNIEDGKETRLVVNLSRKALGRVALAVKLHKRLREPDLLAPTGKAARLPLVIPRVDPASVERESGRLIVYAPESVRVNPAVSDGLRSISFKEALEGMRSTRQANLERPVLAFAYTWEPVALTLAAERRKPHVTARQLLVAGIESGVVKYAATFFYDIRYSGVKRLRIDLPADLADEVRNVTPGVRERVIEPAPEDLPDGYVAWSLTGETEFMGQAVIRLKWEYKIEKLDVGKRVYLVMPRLIPKDVDRAWGQIVLTKAEMIDVRESDRETDRIEGLRPIDPQRDLMPGAGITAAARAFEFHDEWLLTVVATRYEHEEVKRTSIERALLRMVVTRGGVTSMQALYRMRSARQRLAVRLPEGVVFDSRPLRINDRPVPLERGEKDQFFVPLVGQNPDEPFLLELRYTISGAGLRLDPPAFPMEPAVQKVYLSAYLPPAWAYLGSMGLWTEELYWPWPGFGVMPRPTTNDPSLIQWVRQGVKVKQSPEDGFHTDGRRFLFSTLSPPAAPEGSLRLVAFNRDWLSVIVFAVIVAGGIALVPAGPAKRWSAVGAFVVAVVLLGVFCPTFTRQVVNGVMLAAVFIVLVVWFLRYVVVTRPRDPTVRARRETRRVAAEARLSAAKRAAKKTAGPAKPPAGKESGSKTDSGQKDQQQSEGGESHA